MHTYNGVSFYIKWLEIVTTSISWKRGKHSDKNGTFSDTYNFSCMSHISFGSLYHDPAA